MDINGIGSSSSALSELMANRKAQMAEAQPEVETAAVKIAKPEAQNGGIMARNFVSSQDEGVKSYTDAALKGKRAMSMQSTRQQDVLNAAMAQSANATTNAERTLAGKRAARSMMQEMQQSTMEATKRNLDENKQSIRTAAEEAAQGDTAVSSDAAATQVAAAASAPAPATPAPSSNTAGSAPSGGGSSAAASVDVEV